MTDSKTVAVLVSMERARNIYALPPNVFSSVIDATHHHSVDRKDRVDLQTAMMDLFRSANGLSGVSSWLEDVKPSHADVLAAFDRAIELARADAERGA